MSLALKTPSLKLFDQLLSSDNKNGGPELRVGNGVWIDDHLPIFPSYQEILNKTYKVQATPVDFCNKVEAVRKINSWASEKDERTYKGYHRTAILDDDTMVVLGNALYFNGSWEKAFYCDMDRIYTQFHLVNGETVFIPFMTSSEKYCYGTYNGIRILEAPYKCGCNSAPFGMYFFLPEKKDGFQTMIEKFNSDAMLFQKDFDLEEEIFDKLLIPKFKLSYKFEPQNAMKEMGLTLPFHPLNHELTGIVDHQDGELLYISKTVQEACIEVDEKGTEAAAVSFAPTVPGCPPYQHSRLSFVHDQGKDFWCCSFH